VRELENYIERAVVLTRDGELAGATLPPPGHSSRGLKPAGSRGGDLQSLIEQLVRVGIQSIPASEGRLHERLVGGLERELIEQVMMLTDHVQIKAAARLGINRNTLHKKLSEFPQSDAAYPAKDDNGKGR
jgi:DNA-binding NtrC family response regulator